MRMNMMVIVLFAAIMIRSAASSENTSDYVLTAYRLTPAQEGQFVRDGAVSPFWGVWDEKNTDTSRVVYDYVHLTPGVNVYMGWYGGLIPFTGDQDANMFIRAAYGVKGLYLYFGITDDVWQAPEGIATDNVGFLLDRIGSQAIRDADPWTEYIQPSWNWTLTYHSIQYQMSIGSAGASLPGTININYFSGSAMLYNNIDLNQLPTEYAGVSPDLISVNITKRVLEMFIPWQWVGCGGGVGTMPAYGTMIAFDPMYGDADSANQTGGKALRWKPWDAASGAGYPGSLPATPFIDNWCDIQIGPSLNDPTIASHRSHPASVHKPAISAPAHSYDLLGRRNPVVTNKKVGLSIKSGFSSVSF